MFTKISFIISFVIISVVHAVLFYTDEKKKETTVVAQSATIQKLSLKKVRIKQKAVKKQEKKVHHPKIKKRVVPKKIVKQAKKKVLKKTVEKKVKEVQRNQKLVKKEQVKLTPTVTQKVQQKKPQKVVSSVMKNEVKNAYLLKLREKIETYKTYPKRAKRLKQQGQVVVSFKILDNGEIIKTQISEASKYKRLNKAAIELIEKIVRFDPIPKELDKKSWNIEIPINYFIG